MITILDKDRLKSFDEEPDSLKDPEGISYVIVNGKISVEKGQLTGNYYGKTLKKKGLIKK